MVIPKIIYQDNILLVLDKPAGWVVNDADTTKSLDTVQEWLKANFDYEIAKSHDFRSGIVHRLDKPTSGVLLVAKTGDAFENLQKQFAERKVQKTYVALVHGKMEHLEGTVDAPTGRLPWNRRKFGVLPGGREAVTHYKVLKHFELKYENGTRNFDDEVGDMKSDKRSQSSKFDNRTSLSNFNLQNSKFSLLELSPKTGRTHQIRIHLKHLGYPIVADKTYAGRKNWRHDSKWCPRLFLHAKRIKFAHPETRGRVEFKADLPKDLEQALSSLQEEN